MNEATNVFPIAPGDWLGMIGGGQLGRMFCHAAQSLGYKVAVLDPDTASPAGAVADMHIQASYDDEAGLRQLSARCKSVTTEFENVPAQSLQMLADLGSSVRPAAAAVAIVQDRISEKAFIQEAGVPVAPYVPVRSDLDLVAAPDTLFPGILKAARLGYDGKGQARVGNRQEAQQAFAEFGVACVLEALLPLASELSVVMARGADGKTVFFPSAQNEHRDGILAVSSVDAQSAGQALAVQAVQSAQAIAEGLRYVGVLCVEFFVLQDGSLIVNEIAPRPHNSGHYTMNASISSQFEQQARVTAGLPLGSTDSLCSVVMLNILGDVWFDSSTGGKREPDWSAVLAVPGAKLHLYGKAEARRGRKMGHVNVLGATLADAQAGAAQVAQVLGVPF
ncbi:5-(carboxyamino)imidazole ribonucleotide synthase [Alcaligenaceae bacterium]|nr:5-(carboxyamino)imidazole ribonucleotide synthase [Alcaligenaceae bacterium]